MTMWPAIGDVEQVILDMRGSRQAICERKDALNNSSTEMGTIEMGMKSAETQTELIDESNPTSPHDFEIMNETMTIVKDNNNQSRLNINSLRDMKDLKCIDDDTASGHRILFTPDNPETKL